MARNPSPWFWEHRNSWAVVVNGQRQILGPHPEDSPPPRKKNGKWVVPDAIRQRFRQLFAPTPAAGHPQPSLTVAQVFERFLDWCSQHRSPRTYEWSRNHIQSFVNFLKGRAPNSGEPLPVALPCDALKPYHVTEWVDSHRKAVPGKRVWGPNHRRGAITAVQRAFSWAEKQGHIVKSSIRHIEKPASKRREQVLTREEFDALLSHVKDESFRNVLEFCWETGCRVQEIRLLEAGHYKPDHGRFELPPRQAKGKKRWRLIYITERAEEIITPLLVKNPQGPVFRNADGNPWDAQNFNNRFCRLEKKLGVKYALTALRHSFATRLLEAGCDHVTVAMLMGHVDAVMLSRVYSHVGEKSDFLREQLLRASNAQTAAA